MVRVMAPYLGVRMTATNWRAFIGLFLKPIVETIDQ